ncbi:DUF2203 family protein [Candidatus Poribacteria bacterium]|nr:DUF2203 family protein [Candidatus Poribacteria bacterium]
MTPALDGRCPMRRPDGMRQRLGSGLRRFFTLDDANRMIPMLEAWLADMRSTWASMSALEEPVKAVVHHAHLDAGSRDAGRFLCLSSRLRSLQRQIEHEGILLRDIEIGLVDFPSMRLDREIHLCWKSGEPEVRHWHDVDAGYANRRPIDELAEADDGASDEV